MNVPSIKTEVPLAPLTTFRIGGPARYFLRAKSIRDLHYASAYALKRRIPFRVIGGGTNVLVADGGFPGFLVRAEFRGIARKGNEIIAEAGVPMGALLSYAQCHGLGGLEWAAGLPGTLGGAIYGNAGSFGGEIQNVIRSITVFDRRGRVRVIPRRAAAFDYRTSRFKESGEIILSAVLSLAPKRKDGLCASDILNARMIQQPVGERSEGCMFKNVEALKQPLLAHRAFRKMPDLRTRMKDHRIPSGYLIERSGLKGFRLGNVGVSAHHANFMVNYGGGTADEMQILISTVKEKVRREFGLLLEEEVQMLGF